MSPTAKKAIELLATHGVRIKSGVDFDAPYNSEAALGVVLHDFSLNSDTRAENGVVSFRAHGDGFMWRIEYNTRNGEMVGFRGSSSDPVEIYNRGRNYRLVQVLTNTLSR